MRSEEHGLSRGGQGTRAPFRSTAWGPREDSGFSPNPHHTCGDPLRDKTRLLPCDPDHCLAWLPKGLVRTSNTECARLLAFQAGPGASLGPSQCPLQDTEWKTRQPVLSSATGRTQSRDHAERRSRHSTRCQDAFVKSNWDPGRWLPCWAPRTPGTPVGTMAPTPSEHKEPLRTRNQWQQK